MIKIFRNESSLCGSLNESRKEIKFRRMSYFFHVCFSLKSRGKGWFRFSSLARFLQVCLHCRRWTFPSFLPPMLFDVQLTHEKYLERWADDYGEDFMCTALDWAPGESLSDVAKWKLKANTSKRVTTAKWCIMFPQFNPRNYLRGKAAYFSPDATPTPARSPLKFSEHWCDA